MTRVIGISSGKGGVGKTTVAANLAIALSNFGRKVIAVDCNVSTPHLTYYLGAYKYDTTINDVLRGKAEITNALYQHNGVMFVPASLELKDLISIDVAKIKKHVAKLATFDMIDFIFLDSAPGLGREAVSILDASDEIVFVTTPSYPNIRDVVRCIDVVNELGRKPVNIVLNMAGAGRYELNTKDIEAIIKMPVIGSIPYDKNILNGLALRKPIIKYKPNSVASVEFMRLAAALVGEHYEPSASVKLSQFFDRFKGVFMPEKVSVSDFVDEGF